MPELLTDECDDCGEGMTDRCPSSKRPCGHHCNHSWTQDHCHWCGAEVQLNEDGDGVWVEAVPDA